MHEVHAADFDAVHAELIHLPPQRLAALGIPLKREELACAFQQCCYVGSLVARCGTAINDMRPLRWCKGQRRNARGAVLNYERTILHQRITMKGCPRWEAKHVFQRRILSINPASWHSLRNPSQHHQMSDGILVRRAQRVYTEIPWQFLFFLVLGGHTLLPTGRQSLQQRGLPLLHQVKQTSIASYASGAEQALVEQDHQQISVGALVHMRGQARLLGDLVQ
mmetsp:Transcript_8247/g.17122  ORF Transcript_8247/g.17122 Transcript_8247/m.17122 type:complete len:222 (-) Transcript_8247:49-714(-)